MTGAKKRPTPADDLAYWADDIAEQLGLLHAAVAWIDGNVTPFAGYDEAMAIVNEQIASINDAVAKMRAGKLVIREVAEASV